VRDARIPTPSSGDLGGPLGQRSDRRFPPASPRTSVERIPRISAEAVGRRDVEPVGSDEAVDHIVLHRYERPVGDADGDDVGAASTATDAPVDVGSSGRRQHHRNLQTACPRDGADRPDTLREPHGRRTFGDGFETSIWHPPILAVPCDSETLGGGPTLRSGDTGRSPGSVRVHAAGPGGRACRERLETATQSRVRTVGVDPC